MSTTAGSHARDVRFDGGTLIFDTIKWHTYEDAGKISNTLIGEVGATPKLLSLGIKQMGKETPVIIF